MIISEEKEKEILQLIANPQETERGYRLLVQHASEPLYWHIRSIVNSHEDADDVVQTVFIKVWKKIHQFKGESRLYTWLYRIATNEAITFLRAKKKHQIIRIDDVLHNEPSNTEHEAEEKDGAAIAEILQKAMELLPEKQRMVFVMKYFEEMKYEEMSLVTRTSEGALKASYHHAVKKIEKYIRALNL
jgi:RNA polymerase sigma-70 factor (ECF subfamily)